MKSTYRPRVELSAVVFLIVVLAISNVLANRLLPPWSYVPWNVAVAGLVVTVGLRSLSPHALGLARWRSGARWGLAVAAMVLCGYLIAASLPPTRELFDDRRIDGGWQLVLYHTMVRIPLGTVVVEELAFRAVLPALMAFGPCTSTGSGRSPRTAPAWGRGMILASLLFGLWHVLPAWQLSDVNPVLADVFGDDGFGQAAAVVLAVLGTFLAGVGLCLLRYWSGSVLAPIVVHITTNSAAYALAWSLHD